MRGRFDFTRLTEGQQKLLTDAYNLLYGNMDYDAALEDRDAINTACKAIRWLIEPWEVKEVVRTKRPFTSEAVGKKLETGQ